MEAFGGGMFRVALDSGHEALGYTSGKMRRYRIRMNPGDRVKIELSPYDLTRGRIALPQNARTPTRSDDARRCASPRSRERWR